MARKPRFALPGVPQHVIQRGNNRQPCFYTDADYRRYLDDLCEAAEKNQAAVHAYVLMTNHVHILVTPATSYSIMHLMQDLGRKYVRYINRTHQRSGTLWEGRYRASLVDSEAYLLTCMRYIELNPVRANMVIHPRDYRWSSYRSNAAGQPNQLVTQHPLYQSLGDTDAQRQYRYRELFRGELGDVDIHAIRDALNQELVLGRKGFKVRIETMTNRQALPKRRGRPRAEENRSIDYII